MIKQIQLRGISRTPSDRLSEDGGLSESLNMYMDTAENAPAIVPKDVTTDLKLPAYLQAERIFIHKTANYENYIVVQEGRVVAYTPDVEDEEPLTVLELTDGEKVNDITSVGNTLIFCTTKDLYYVLYKEKKYIPQGNKIPFPYINFDLVEKQGAAVLGYFEPDLQNLVTTPDLNYLESQWNTNKDGQGQHLNESVSKQLASLWSNYDSLYQRAAEERDKFSSPIFVRYAIEMFDGSLVSSMPILLNPRETDLVAAAGYWEGEREGQHQAPEFFYDSRLQLNVTEYKVKATLTNSDEYDSWKDFYSSIKIYITRPFIHFINRNASSISNIKEETPTGDYTYVVSAEVHATALTEEALLEQSANAYEVKTIELFDNKGGLTKDFKDLGNGIEFGPSIIPESGYEEQNLLIKDDMKHYAQTSEKINTYNNQLILIQSSQLIDYDYNRLNSYDIVTPQGSNQNISSITYDVTYILRTYTEDKIIKKQFTYNYLPTEEEKIYAFQIFPDSRTYKMIIKTTITSSDGQTIQYGEFDMHPHPYLDCAYYFGGTSNELVDLCNLATAENYAVNYVDNLDNKVLVSEMNNPRFFPTEHRYTFQSKVIGIAVANTALSQGQFGQFPLYVFTEDGIWVMETAADGSFVSQKPLSREVCVNPASITSIDNAVIFVTDKAVMLIQGSEVVNISAYMNGKHYIPNDSARSIIAKQDGFGIYDSAISDETPFMAFMKKASIAYDYVGQRLICFAPEETFQYIYKIDTQTWHKTKFGEINLTSPLNSYPECLVASTYKSNVTYIEAAIRPNYTIEQAEEDSNNIATDCANMDIYADTIPNLFKAENLYGFIKGEIKEVIVTGNVEDFVSTLNDFVYGINSIDKCVVNTEERPFSKIYNLSTVLDTTENQDAAKGILITRPFDLGMPDVFKSITSIKIRGDYDKGNVKYILQGSDNGRDFYTLNSLRGKSWKMFRIFILADLEPTERLSWIDIDFEPKFNNRLR